MIDYATYARLRHLQEDKGLTPTQIARELGLDERTVRRWLAAKQFLPRKAVDRSSKLDPFKDTVIRMIESYPYSAQQVLQRLREEGFTGGYTIVKQFVRKVRPKRTKAFLTLAFAPGECAQVDWGSYGVIRVGETMRRLSFFVMVLCHSRQMYVEFTVSQAMEQFLTCHQNAFHAFGGVPARIMVDNLKSAVLTHAAGEAPVFNPRYLAFAQYHGFTISACGVAIPRSYSPTGRRPVTSSSSSASRPWPPAPWSITWNWSTVTCTLEGMSERSWPWPRSTANPPWPPRWLTP